MSSKRKAKAVTLLEASKTDERHPEVDAQTAAGATRKLGKEVAEGDGLIDKAKRAVEEADRQIAGEYERRDQPK